jgi:hypothetical protein
MTHKPRRATTSCLTTFTSSVSSTAKPEEHFPESGCGPHGLDVTANRVYEWDPPEDTAPLREALHRLAVGRIDVALFTTPIQVTHLFRAAAENLEEPIRAALRTRSWSPPSAQTLAKSWQPAEICERHGAEPSQDGPAGQPGCAKCASASGSETPGQAPLAWPGFAYVFVR